MRAVRKPIVETHEIIFYLLAISVILHLIGVAFTEIKEKNAIVSAMITGKKLFRSQPVDIDKQ
jgi:cytochrome b